MTTFNTSMLPTGTRQITTLEELAAWSAISLAVLNPKATFVRRVGVEQEQVATFGDYQDANGDFRLQLVTILKIDPSKIGLSLPDWKIVAEVSTSPALSSFSG